MQVQNNDSKQINPLGKISQVAFPALAGGVIAQSCHELMLPVETRFALKNARLSQDKFVAGMKQYAEQTMKELELSRAAEIAAKKANGIPYIEVGKTINLETVAENAKKIYPELVDTAKNAKKALNKTLVSTAVLIAGAKLLSMAVFAHKNSKNKQASEVQNTSVSL